MSPREMTKLLDFSFNKFNVNHMFVKCISSNLGHRKIIIIRYRHHYPISVDVDSEGGSLSIFEEIRADDTAKSKFTPNGDFF